LSRGRFVELETATPFSAGVSRALARRIWHGRIPVPAQLGREAALLAGKTPETPGRVHSLGRFEDETAWQALEGSLPQPLGASLRRPFEWYACRGAGFHTDAHYEGVLFGAWCLAGPERDVVFASAGPRLACAPGDLVVFDPFQPHAVLDRGQTRYDRDHYAAAAASVFLGFELHLDAAARERFGIGPPGAGSLAIGSATAVNAETGQIVR
jgi:hypothetical protein